uniref:Uncharacterized protein n=1 Tax=Cacopsylla melanoneura TaxID=428564 RepID=A0A8D8W4U0_9HEMI
MVISRYCSENKRNFIRMKSGPNDSIQNLGFNNESIIVTCNRNLNFAKIIACQNWKTQNFIFMESNPNDPIQNLGFNNKTGESCNIQKFNMALVIIACKKLKKNTKIKGENRI